MTSHNAVGTDNNSNTFFSKQNMSTNRASSYYDDLFCGRNAAQRRLSQEQCRNATGLFQKLYGDTERGKYGGVYLEEGKQSQYVLPDEVLAEGRPENVKAEILKTWPEVQDVKISGDTIEVQIGGSWFEVRDNVAQTVDDAISEQKYGSTGTGSVSKYYDDNDVYCQRNARNHGLSEADCKNAVDLFEQTYRGVVRGREAGVYILGGKKYAQPDYVLAAGQPENIKQSILDTWPSVQDVKITGNKIDLKINGSWVAVTESVKKTVTEAQGSRRWTPPAAATSSRGSSSFSRWPTRHSRTSSLASSASRWGSSSSSRPEGFRSLSHQPYLPEDWANAEPNQIEGQPGETKRQGSKYDDEANNASDVLVQSSESATSTGATVAAAPSLSTRAYPNEAPPPYSDIDRYADVPPPYSASRPYYSRYLQKYF